MFWKGFNEQKNSKTKYDVDFWKIQKIYCHRSYLYSYDVSVCDSLPVGFSSIRPAVLVKYWLAFHNLFLSWYWPIFLYNFHKSIFFAFYIFFRAFKKNVVTFLMGGRGGKEGRSWLHFCKCVTDPETNNWCIIIHEDLRTLKKHQYLETLFKRATPDQ